MLDVTLGKERRRRGEEGARRGEEGGMRGELSTSWHQGLSELCIARFWKSIRELMSWSINEVLMPSDMIFEKEKKFWGHILVRNVEFCKLHSFVSKISCFQS